MKVSYKLVIYDFTAKIAFMVFIKQLGHIVYVLFLSIVPVGQIVVTRNYMVFI